MEMQPLQTTEQARTQRYLPLIVCGILIALVVGLFVTLKLLPKIDGVNAHTAAVGAAQTPFDNVSLVAKSAIVIDLTDGKTLFAQNADTQLPLASLTKIPLVLAVTDVLSLDSRITIPQTLQSADATMLLEAGERWRLQDLIDFTLVTSSNDGAELLADIAASALRNKYKTAPASNPALWRMNEIAREMDLRQTYFLNVSGLDVSTTLAGSYGSARDMTKLFERAVESGTLAFSGTARGNVFLTSETGTSQTIAHNTNQANPEIPGLILGKTGFTDLAGGNLGVVFDVGIGHPVVVVVLGSTIDGRFEDMKQLIEAARESITASR